MKDTGYCYCDVVDLTVNCGISCVNSVFNCCTKFPKCPNVMMALSFISDLLDTMTDFTKAGSFITYTSWCLPLSRVNFSGIISVLVRDGKLNGINSFGPFRHVILSQIFVVS